MESYQPPQGRLTAEQTAMLLGVTRGNLRLLVRRGHLHHAGGTRYRPQFDVAEVTALHAARMEPSGQPLTQPECHSA
ncbi:hypothetical protein PV569_13000 [Streptomyces scabiei]|uniref:hypothetical protein n=1 Tax=Streptomyces scabiei TaxID=1930 RepID=UPI0029A4044E|nr:hypothetical protein [Streptomyces scabiei]MDX3294624.1 hypothetical protein [Streptomyces scabiei]